jgi:hypothetical protein
MKAILDPNEDWILIIINLNILLSKHAVYINSLKCFAFTVV